MPRPSRRPISQWLNLLLVWTVGLLIWGLYLAAALYLLFRLF